MGSRPHTPSHRQSPILGVIARARLLSEKRERRWKEKQLQIHESATQIIEDIKFVENNEETESNGENPSRVSTEEEFETLYHEHEAEKKDVSSFDHRIVPIEQLTAEFTSQTDGSILHTAQVLGERKAHFIDDEVFGNMPYVNRTGE